MYSRDNGNSVQIISKDYTDGNGPAVILTKGNIKTRIGYGGINTGDVFFSDPWTEHMSALDMFKDLYGKVSTLRDRISDLEG